MSVTRDLVTVRSLVSSYNKKRKVVMEPVFGRSLWIVSRFYSTVTLEFRLKVSKRSLHFVETFLLTITGNLRIFHPTPSVIVLFTTSLVQHKHTVRVQVDPVLFILINLPYPLSVVWSTQDPFYLR